MGIHVGGHILIFHKKERNQEPIQAIQEILWIKDTISDPDSILRKPKIMDLNLHAVTGGFAAVSTSLTVTGLVWEFYREKRPGHAEAFMYSLPNRIPGIFA